MQLLRPMRLDAHDYVATDAHRHVRRPSECPHCYGVGTLRVLGYYERYTTSHADGAAVQIKVRRFVCLNCKRTLSLLPSFAQPYRLVCNADIERYFQNKDTTLPTWRWLPLLRCYWRRFTEWLPDLMSFVGQVLGLPPPHAPMEISWRSILATYGNLEHATQNLVRRFGVTLFGRYCCHSPVTKEGQVCH